MSKFNFLKKNVVLQLILIFLVVLLLGNSLPYSLKAFFYSISLTLNNLLLFVIPFIIFLCLFTSLSAINFGRSFWSILVLLGIVFISNYLSTLIAYFVGSAKANKS